MVLNRSRFDKDYCAAGNIVFQGLDPDKFKSKPPYQIHNGRRFALCAECEQWTQVKKDGFFVKHSSSVKGEIPQGFKGNTQYSHVPPRVRGRKQ